MLRFFTFLAITLVSGQPQNSCDPGFTWDGRECVQDGPVTCSSPTPYKYGSDCYDSCPSGTYIYFSDCVSDCPSGSYKYAGSCVGGCPSRTYNGACVDSCPAGTVDYSNSCMDACPSYTVTDGSRCYDNCPSGSYKYNSGCVSACPAVASFIYKGECRDECWKSGLYYTSPGSKECVYSCPAVYEWANNTCIDKCAPGQKISGTGCYDQCPSTMPYANNGRCDVSCPTLVDMTSYNCVDSCPAGTALNGKRCEKMTCSNSQYIGSDNQCHNYPSHNHTTVSCGSNQYMNSNGTCIDTVTCSSDQYLDADGRCHDYQNTCPFWFNNTCVLACPKGTLVTDWNSCVNSCPDDMIQNGTRCELRCPTGQRFMNGTCYDYGSGGNWTTNPCPDGQYMTSTGTCMTPCRADQWYWNNTCIPACKEGDALTMEGKCMNMVSMCEQALPGSIMNNVTRSCECLAGQWISHDPNSKDPAKMPVRCNPGGPGRINCRSFVANTVYDPTVDNCVCDAANPIVVPVADKTWFPYACAPTGTSTTVKQCVAPEYFDFMDGRCVKPDSNTYTPTPKPSVRPSIEAVPTPSISAKPTRTAMPSRYPSQSISASRTPKPSNIPGSPSPSTTPSRSVKPSALIFADVTRKPLPSLTVANPPPVEVRRSPVPSPWPKKVTMEIPPEEKPAYIDARMTVAGGNATEIAKPERIQQMQASLACTLRMPLENIRIQNITATDAAGRKTRIDVDPVAFMMVGDGSTDCYDFRNMTTDSRRMLRALSGSSGAIEIDYAIVNPSDAILTMDTSQFNDVIRQSPVIFAAVAAVGGTSVTAQAVDNQKVDTPVPSASPQGTLLSSTGAGSTINDLRVILGGGIAGVALVVGATVLATFYYKEAKRAKRLLQDEQKRKAGVANPRVVMVYTEEKHQMMNPLATHRAESMRFDYSPEVTRRTTVPVKATHSPLFGSAV
jgi:hypothetical protein